MFEFFSPQIQVLPASQWHIFPENFIKVHTSPFQEEVSKLVGKKTFYIDFMQWKGNQSQFCKSNLKILKTPSNSMKMLMYLCKSHLKILKTPSKLMRMIIYFWNDFTGFKHLNISISIWTVRHSFIYKHSVMVYKKRWEIRVSTCEIVLLGSEIPAQTHR